MTTTATRKSGKQVTFMVQTRGLPFRNFPTEAEAEAFRLTVPEDRRHFITIKRVEFGN